MVHFYVAKKLLAFDVQQVLKALNIISIHFLRLEYFLFDAIFSLYRKNKFYPEKPILFNFYSILYFLISYNES